MTITLPLSRVRLLLFLFVSLHLTGAARAQGLPGYVVTLAGDTLRGSVLERPQQRVDFYYTPKSQPQHFSPTQIRGYGLRGQTLIQSMPVRQAAGGTTTAFVLPTQLGKASLYSYADETGFLLRPEAADTLYELSPTNWHVLLNRYLRGCPSLDHSSYAMLALSFTEANLQRIFSQYNRCLDPAWRMATTPKQAAWRRGLRLRGMYAYTYVTPEENRASRGLSRQLLAEWYGVRATGLEASVGLGYTLLSLQNEYRPVGLNPGQLGQEQQERVQVHMATVAMHVGQRIELSNRLGLVLGGGMLFNLQMHGTTETYVRQASSTQLVSSMPERGVGGAVSMEATAGLAFALAQRHELTVQGAYQHFFFFGVRSVGAQVGYTFFRH